MRQVKNYTLILTALRAHQHVLSGRYTGIGMPCNWQAHTDKIIDRSSYASPNLYNREEFDPQPT